MDYRTDKNKGIITLWDDAAGVGLQFNKGEILSSYTASIVLRDPSIMETTEGMEKVNEISSALREQATKDYPKEFKPI